MRVIGIALLIVGALTLAYGAMEYGQAHQSPRMDTLGFGASAPHNLSVPALVGLVTLIGGASLFITSNRRPWCR